MKNKKTSFLLAGLFLIGTSSFAQQSLTKSAVLIFASISTGTFIPPNQSKIELESFHLIGLTGASYYINSSIGIDLNFSISTAENVINHPVTQERFQNKNQQISLGISHFL